MEKRVVGSTTEYRHFVQGPGRAVAIVKRVSDGTGATFYLTEDHLGSTSALTNTSGSLLANESFSAFGGRRRGSSWTGPPSSTEGNWIAASSRRGFTSHEHLDNLDLIHMNGRVYDPVIGRFMSADPFVQAPFDGQSLNRYSYVRNNPLSLTDPSGFNGDDPDDDWFPFPSPNPCAIFCVPQPNNPGTWPGRPTTPPGILDPLPEFPGRIPWIPIAPPPTPEPSPPVPPSPVPPVSTDPPANWINPGRPPTPAVDTRNAAQPSVPEWASTSGGTTNGAQWESPLEEPLRGGFSDLLSQLMRQLNEWTSLPPYVTEDGQEIPYITGMPPLPGGPTTGIAITQSGLAHVLARHTAGGARTAGKSLFSAGEDVSLLIRNASPVARSLQVGGNYERTIEAGRIIGMDRATGQPTSIYTVITNAADDLITAFPGRP